MVEKSELSRTADMLQKVHAEALQAFCDEEKKIDDAFRTQNAQAAKDYDHGAAIAYTSVSNSAAQADNAIKDAVSKIKETSHGLLRTAEYLELGQIRISGKRIRLNEDFVIPMFVPFLGHSNLFIKAPHSEIINLSRELVLHALSQTAAGQLEVYFYDPDLSNAASPFSVLSNKSDVLHVISQQRGLENELASLIKDMQQTASIMRGAANNLVEFRKRIQQPVSVYKVIVLLNFPKGINEDTYVQLLSLLKSAPAMGISFIIISSEDAKWEKEIDQKSIAQLCQNFYFDNKKICWQGQKNLDADFAYTDISEIIRKTDEMVEQIETQKAPPIIFSNVEKSKLPWSESSAEGITFCLGSSGLDTVEVRLGDEKTQKHNAVISGAVGQGKSNLIKVIIYSLCSRYSPTELNLYLLDFKEGVTLYPFSNLGSPDYLPQAKVLGLESDREFGVAVLQHLENEFTRRSKLFKKYGDNISKFRSANPDAVMPRIVLIIDEFHFLFNIDDSIGQLAAEKLEALSRKGRAYGIHIILASQSITGAAALNSKQEGIYGQFPVRIALKNHLAESYATFVQGNDGAAKLKIRGQAVINYEYGAIDSNQFFTVAWAPDNDLDKLRISLWEAAKDSTVPPTVFDGSATRHISEVMCDIKESFKAFQSEISYPAFYIGIPISVDQQPLKIFLRDESGRNIVILGSGEDSTIESENEEPRNSAIGILQSGALGLAMQHQGKKARFIVFDLLDKTTAKKNNQEEWLGLMRQIGADVEVITKNDIPAFISETAALLEENAETGHIYIIAFSMDRAGSLEIEDQRTYSPVIDLFRDILKNGPSKGIHFIGWWTNAGTYSSHINYTVSGYVETKIVLRLDSEMTREVMGQHTQWEAKENRALVGDQTQLTNSVTVVPFAPINKADIDTLAQEDWGDWNVEQI